MFYVHLLILASLYFRGRKKHGRDGHALGNGCLVPPRRGVVQNKRFTNGHPSFLFEVGWATIWYYKIQNSHVRFNGHIMYSIRLTQGEEVGDKGGRRGAEGGGGGLTRGVSILTILTNFYTNTR